MVWYFRFKYFLYSVLAFSFVPKFDADVTIVWQKLQPLLCQFVKVEVSFADLHRAMRLST